MIRHAALVFIPLLFACSPSNEPEQAADDLEQAVSAWRSEARMRNDRLLKSAERFESSIRGFLDDTNESNLESVRDAWKRAHGDFLAADVYFVGQTNDLAFRLDAWPIMEGFLDSVPGHPQSGIVNDYAINIETTTLINQHGLTSREEVSLGFHALEYFVFSRPLTDFLPVHLTDTETNSRRRDACRIIAELLVMDLNQFVQLSNDRLASLGEGPEASTTLVRALDNTSENLKIEAERLIDEDNGHSRFSRTSWEDLRARLEPLSRIAGEPIRIGSRLPGANEEQESNFAETLAELSAIMEEEASIRSERIPLLLTTLHHQTEYLDRQVRIHARQDQGFLPP